MSDTSGGAYASGPSAPGGTSKAKQVAGQGKQAATQAAVDVKDTATEQVQRVGAEAASQARTVAAEVRDKVTEQARTQSDKLVSTIRETADHLDEMRSDRQDSPAAAVVSRVADGGRQLADYLDRHGPEGVLQEVQDFARRRPGAFLATALAAGFVVGRLGKSVAKADPHAGSPTATSEGDALVSPSPKTFPSPMAPNAAHDTAPNGAAVTTANRAGTDSPGAQYAATGTGAPTVLDEFTRMQARRQRP